MPLVIGMPVLIMQNFDVPEEVVNGSRGFVCQIRYTLEANNCHVLQSCIVEIPDAEPTTMTNLPPRHYSILPDTIRLKFTDQYTHASQTIYCTQAPIVPAFAMTAHQAQGQTMTQVIVDLESCCGTEALYIMLFHASSLLGILVLHLFVSKKVTCSLLEDA